MTSYCWTSKGGEDIKSEDRKSFSVDVRLLGRFLEIELFELPLYVNYIMSPNSAIHLF